MHSRAPHAPWNSQSCTPSPNFALPWPCFYNHLLPASSQREKKYIWIEIATTCTLLFALIAVPTAMVPPSDPSSFSLTTNKIKCDTTHPPPSGSR
mmetsp:Transcript_39624/g.83309  ORF Transcript_39624/g.83309 Transcript_39624/m.83309 type:complete len:95 (+) Transcript_39624:277-561(+)